MVDLLNRGCYRARLVRFEQDVASVQALRTLAFGTSDTDCDQYDAV